MSVIFGSHSGNFVSESKQMFDSKSAQRDTLIKQMIDKNRSPHFKFSDHPSSTKEEMTSIMKSQYDYKGNSVNCRGYMDPAVMADLRAHHF